MKLFVCVALALFIAACVADTPPKLPRIGYIALGYNIYTANPNEIGQLDPGFQIAGEIFSLSYGLGKTTPDGQWTIPNFVSAKPTDSCEERGKSNIIQGTQDYSSSLENSVTTSAKYYTASFSASSTYKQVQNRTSSYKDVFTSSSASCLVYQAAVNDFKLPAFNDVFFRATTSLPDTYNANTAEAFWRYFDTYGTHYPIKLNLGAQWGFLFRSTEEQYKTMQAQSLSISTAASYAGMISAGVNVSNSQDKSLATSFMSEITDKQTFSKGNPPPTDGNAQSWAKETVSSKFLVPITYDVEPITNLFTVTTNTTLKQKGTVVGQALADYCVKHLKPLGKTDCAAATNPPVSPPAPMTGSFSSKQYSVANSWGSAGYTFVGKFTNDPYPDIAGCNGGAVYIKANYGSGEIHSLSWDVTNQWGGYTFVGDFNKDGLDDIASFSNVGAFMKINQGGNGFSSVLWSISQPRYSGYHSVMDVNNDGYLDVVFPNGAAVTVMENNNGGGFIQKSYAISATAPSSWGGGDYTWFGSEAYQSGKWEIADFNKDGYADIATASGSNVYMKLGTHAPAFSGAIWANSGQWGNGACSWVADFNLDGYPDIASANGANVYMSFSKGTHFVSNAWSVVGQWGDCGYMKIGDFNGDGRPDIASPSGTNMFIKLNTGDGFLSQNWVTDGRYGSGAYTWVADWNQDGKSDIVSANGGFVYIKFSN